MRARLKALRWAAAGSPRQCCEGVAPRGRCHGPARAGTAPSAPVLQLPWQLRCRHLGIVRHPFPAPLHIRLSAVTIGSLHPNPRPILFLRPKLPIQASPDVGEPELERSKLDASGCDTPQGAKCPND